MMFWVCSAVFVIVMAFLLFAVFRPRPKGGAAASEKTERDMARVVTGAVAVTMVILFVFLVVSYSVGRRISSSPGSDLLTIKVTGYQWWWEIEYEDAVPSNIVTTANEIHIPVGQPVALKLTSRDVIHSFWVLDSQAIKPGNRMPPNNLSSEELHSLLTYLENLK